MAVETKMDVMHSRLWEEEPEAGDPFTARAAYCSGYDVYGDLLEKASYAEYLYLLFRGEKPSAKAARALEILAVAIANPGPRDPSVHAAMCAGVGGSPAAAALMAALAAGAGVSGGAREVFAGMGHWLSCGTDLEKWRVALRDFKRPAGGKLPVWPEAEHPPGFSPRGEHAALPVLQTLDALSARLRGGHIAWLRQHHRQLERLAGCGLAMPGVIAAALSDLGLDPAAGEMMSLLLRLPGAAAHALEQQEGGIRRFPFFSIDIENDPGPDRKGMPR